MHRKTPGISWLITLLQFLHTIDSGILIDNSLLSSFEASCFSHSMRPGVKFVALFLNQSKACEVESTWSSYFPFGNVTISCKYSDRHDALSGRYTNPFSMVLVTECIRIILSIVGSYFLISCIPSLTS